MTGTPPLDQRIVDEYFYLASKRGSKNIAWLFAMVATYGLTPQQLIDESYIWHHDCLIIPSRKRPIRPLHPQWVILFQLKEKQPHDPWSCLGSLSTRLYKAMALQEISMNITDLLLAHSIRKKYYASLKQRQASPVFAGAS